MYNVYYNRLLVFKVNLNTRYDFTPSMRVSYTISQK